MKQWLDKQRAFDGNCFWGTFSFCSAVASCLLIRCAGVLGLVDYLLVLRFNNIFNVFGAAV